MSKRLLSLLTRGFLDNARFAARAVVSNKLRSFLTLLGIVIGVATVIGMVSVIVGFNNNVIGNFERFGSTLVQFQKFDPRFGPGRNDEEERQRANLTIEDAEALKRLCPSMEPRSRMVKMPLPSPRMSACRRETVASSIWMWQVGSRPTS